MKLHLYTMAVLLTATALILLIVRYSALVFPAFVVVVSIVIAAAAYDATYRIVAAHLARKQKRGRH